MGLYVGSQVQSTPIWAINHQKIFVRAGLVKLEVFLYERKRGLPEYLKSSFTQRSRKKGDSTIMFVECYSVTFEKL